MKRLCIRLMVCVVISVGACVYSQMNGGYFDASKEAHSLPPACSNEDCTTDNYKLDLIHEAFSFPVVDRIDSWVREKAESLMRITPKLDKLHDLFGEFR